MKIDLEEMIASYVACALVSSCDDDGDPLDSSYSPDDIDSATLNKMREDCENFLEANKEDLEASGLDSGQIGHDFWLTRNGHGAGFWDRGLGELGERLSKACKPYGSVDLIAGDDEKIYG
jgi:hypothetical protein